MQTTIDLQAITNRVLGVVPPRSSIRPGRPRRGDMILAVALLFTSAAATIGIALLWASGHRLAAARLFCGVVMLLMALIRIR
jgi:hypothetical protein